MYNNSHSQLRCTHYSFVMLYYTISICVQKENNKMTVNIVSKRAVYLSLN